MTQQTEIPEYSEEENGVFCGIPMQHVKKFLVPVVLVFTGVFLGGIVSSALYLGALTTGGVWIVLNQVREAYPAYYNWLMDHSVEADFALSTLAVLGLGFSVTGLIAGAVVNILVGIALDYHREVYGKVKDQQGNDIKSASAMDVFKALILAVKNLFKNIFGSFKKEKKSVQKIEAISVETVV